MDFINIQEALTCAIFCSAPQTAVASRFAGLNKTNKSVTNLVHVHSTWIVLQRGAWKFEIHRTMISLQK